MNIFNFLTPKSETFYLSDQSTIRQALEKFDYHKFSIVPLLDEEGHYVTTLSEGDLLRFIKNNWPFRRLTGGRNNGRSGGKIPSVQISDDRGESLAVVSTVVGSEFHTDRGRPNDVHRNRQAKRPSPVFVFKQKGRRNLSRKTTIFFFHQKSPTDAQSDE